ncbi:MAG: hypothetical protein M3R50_03660, partial [Bacteroidota bacterium]|nr:hypothetical protein [Bacteroidota bacterium]
MNHLKSLAAIIFSSCMLYACSGNSSTTSGRDSAISSENSSANSLGDASFSYKIDGKTYSGKGTD